MLSLLRGIIRKTNKSKFRTDFTAVLDGTTSDTMFYAIKMCIEDTIDLLRNWRNWK